MYPGHLKQHSVHASHCCKHGCKYGSETCPVVRGEVEQLYACYEVECGETPVNVLAGAEETPLVLVNAQGRVIRSTETESELTALREQIDGLTGEVKYWKSEWAKEVERSGSNADAVEARQERDALRQRVAELEQEKALLFESLGELNSQTVAAEEFGVTKSRQNAALREQVAALQKRHLELEKTVSIYYVSNSENMSTNYALSLQAKSLRDALEGIMSLKETDSASTRAEKYNAGRIALRDTKALADTAAAGEGK